MKTFGHTGISLGGLYSAIEDRFMPAMGLWSAEDIEKNKQTIHHPKADTFWTTRQTKDEKIDTLSIVITGSVGLNLPVVPSPIKATASLKYIQKTDVRIIFLTPFINNTFIRILNFMMLLCYIIYLKPKLKL